MAEQGDALAAKVLTYLDKTGYPLEMRVAAEVRKTDAYLVNQSRYYVDPLTDKIRETDVVGGWRSANDGAHSYAFLVIECKDKKDKPWVAFDSNLDEEEEVDELLMFDLLRKFESNEEHSFRDRVRHPAFRVEGTLIEPQRLSHAIVETFIDSEKREGRDSAWEAVQAALSATEGLLRDIESQDLNEARFVGAVALPVVVTSAPLFRAWLDDEGTMRVRRTSEVNVVARLATSSQEARIAVINEDLVPMYVRRSSNTADALLPHASSH